MIDTNKSKLKIAVGVSGSGRSLLNLLKQQSERPYSIELVFSSSPTAAANQIAANYNIPLLVLDFSKKNLEQTQQKLYEAFEEFQIRLVVLAGFLKLFPVYDGWHSRIINIHPSLLPRYGGKGMYGLRVHDAVIKSGDRISGATVHFVDQHYDQGRIIAQSDVILDVDESTSSLAQKVFQAECRLLPEVLSGFWDGRLPARSVMKLSQRGEFIESY